MGQKKEVVAKQGRPTKYKPEYDSQAFKLTLLGATDVEIADIFCVTESTIHLWKHEHPSFSESLKKGKLQADAEIASSLYHRAKGYSHEDVHIANYLGETIITPITKHYPPDTAAMMIWLKNRQGKKWKDKQEHIIDVGDNIKELIKAVKGNNMLESSNVIEIEGTVIDVD